MKTYVLIFNVAEIKSNNDIFVFCVEQTSPIPMFQRMHAFMSSISPSPYTSSNQEGIRRVRESGGAYAFLLGEKRVFNEHKTQLLGYL